MEAAKEWQRLHALYSAMGEEELLELREQFDSLTDQAQALLHDELRKRRLPEPVAGGRDSAAQASNERLRRLETLSAGESGSDPGIHGSGPRAMRQYAWKVTLRKFSAAEDAWMAHEALKAEGIESWLQVPRSAMDPTVPMVQVASDDLDRAAAVLAKPIPEELRVTASAEIEDFELPYCPRCRAQEALLESTDPANQWSCEACGHTWQEEIPLSE